jgi:hypothetical protein
VDRVDQNIGDRARLFFRYQRQDQKIANGSAIPYNAAEVPSKTDNFTVGYTQTVKANLINDFRIGRQAINTDSVNYFYVNGIADAGTKLGIAGFDADSKSKNPGTPEFNVSGFSGWGNSGTNWFQIDHTWQASEQVSWTLRNHSIMAGLEFRKLYTSRSAANSPRGVFSFNGQFTGYAPADFMMGFVQNLVTPTVQYQGDVATWRDGFFVLDNWQGVPKADAKLWPAVRTADGALLGSRLRPRVECRADGRGSGVRSFARLPVPRSQSQEFCAARRPGLPLEREDGNSPGRRHLL